MAVQRRIGKALRCGACVAGASCGSPCRKVSTWRSSLPATSPGKTRPAGCHRLQVLAPPGRGGHGVGREKRPSRGPGWPVEKLLEVSNLGRIYQALEDAPKRDRKSINDFINLYVIVHDTRMLTEGALGGAPVQSGQRGGGTKHDTMMRVTCTRREPQRLALPYVGPARPRDQDDEEP